EDFVPPFPGVAKADAERYAAAKESGSFACIEGGKLVPTVFMNDEYCDCADGSDEPGTSACEKGRFYCVNAGHRGAFLPSSRVRDGVCDCCDGSDEVGGPSSCRDNCADEFAAWARKHADVMKELEAGARAKAKYAAQGEAGVAAKEMDLAAARQELELISLELEQARAVVTAETEREAEEKAAKFAAAEEAVRRR
ncbi:unnamed protein product, partial [Phaeothamnion confervicola]